MTEPDSERTRQVKEKYKHQDISTPVKQPKPPTKNGQANGTEGS